MTKKTLLVSEIFPPTTGGSGRWFFEVYSRLSKKDYYIAGGTHPDAEQFDKQHPELSIDRWHLKIPSWGILSFSGLYAYTTLFFKLAGTIRREKIEALHSARNLPEGFLCWLASKLFRRPYLTYVHGEELQTLAASRELFFMSRLVYNGAQRIIVNSANTKRLMIDYYPSTSDKIRIVHPGVNSEYFVPAKPSEKVRKELGWGNRTVMITVGRLQKRKGHDNTIRALHAIKKAIPDILYVIIGNGEENEHLRELVRELNLEEHVQFRGEITDGQLLRCYQQCDLFILANRDINGDIEGFGMVLVEAQACGKPVIAGDSGGTAETMIPGETGLLIDCTNPDLIAKGVISILTDQEKHRAISKKARDWVENNLDWKSLVHKAAAIFDEL
ncbi:MAG: glycosyltransferase family 4 protein [Candidatus Auribacterota bacterium]